MMTLKPVTIADKPILAALMQLYLYDSSDYTREDLNRQGRYAYHYFDAYWTEDGRYPFLIYLEDQIVGLVLVRALEMGADPLHQLAEFFILRKYRRHGIGRAAAFAAFDRFPGRWEVQQHADNLAGQAFWRRIINDYTQGAYHDEVRDTAEHRGPAQLFVSR